MKEEHPDLPYFACHPHHHPLSPAPQVAPPCPRAAAEAPVRIHPLTAFPYICCPLPVDGPKGLCRLNIHSQEFLSGPVVRTLCFHAGGMGWILGRESCKLGAGGGGREKNSQPSLAALGLVCQTMAETALAPDSNGIIYSKWSPKKPSLLRQMEVSKGCL